MCSLQSVLMPVCVRWLCWIGASDHRFLKMTGRQRQGCVYCLVAFCGFKLCRALFIIRSATGRDACCFVTLCRFLFLVCSAISRNACRLVTLCRFNLYRVLFEIRSCEWLLQFVSARYLCLIEGCDWMAFCSLACSLILTFICTCLGGCLGWIGVIGWRGDCLLFDSHPALCGSVE